MNGQLRQLYAFVENSPIIKKTETSPMLYQDNPVQESIHSAPHKMRIVAVTSGKGGVGKTNLTLNLALALQDYGHRITVMDGDLGLGNLDIACGITSPFNISHLLNGKKGLEDILIPTYGMNIIPGGSGVQELSDLTAEQLKTLIAEFSKLEKITDIYLIDTGAGINKTVLNFLNASDDILVVITPEPTSLTDGYALLKVLYQQEQEKTIHIIVNRVKHEQEAREVFARLERAVKSFLNTTPQLMGWIYEDPAVREAIIKQLPLGKVSPQSKAYQCIDWIAGSISGIYTHPPKKSLGIRGFLANLLKR